MSCTWWNATLTQGPTISCTKRPSRTRRCTLGRGRSASLYIAAWKRTFNCWNSSVCRLPKSCCSDITTSRQPSEQETSDESSTLDFDRDRGRIVVDGRWPGPEDHRPSASQSGGEGHGCREEAGRIS